MSNLFNIFINLGLSTGLSIILLSVSISLLLIPIDYLIEKRKKKLKPKLEKIQPIKEEIERAYTGQSRFYYLKTLYRQNQYSFLDQFLPSFSLLIQIPVFILAYHFLKSQNFQNTSFLFIKDLSLNDGLITWKGMGLNALPILMTLINLLSIELQAGADRSSKVLLRLISLLFLFLLYSMPSAMVLYWLTSNILFLLKLLLKRDARDILKIRSNNIFFDFQKLIHSITYDSFWYLSSIILSCFCFLIYFGSSTHNGGSLKTGLMILSLSLIFYFFQFKSTKKQITQSPFSFSFFLYTVIFLCTPVWYYFLGNPDFFNISYLFEVLATLILPFTILGGLLTYFVIKLHLTSKLLLFYLVFLFTFLMMPFFNYKLNLDSIHNFPIPIFIGLSIYHFVKKIQPHTVYKLIQLGAISSVFLGIACFVTIDLKIKETKSITKKKEEVKFNNEIKDIQKKPDVFFLVYDSLMDEKYFKFLGLESNNFINLLKKNKFQIYQNKLSLEKYSIGSIGKLFSSFDLEQNGNKKNISDYKKILSGHNFLDRYLSSQGYTSSMLATSYFISEDDKFKKDVQVTNKVGNVVLRGLLVGAMSSEIITDITSDLNPWEILKKNYFNKPQINPRWIYLHNYNPGHAPLKGICDNSWLNKFKDKLKTFERNLISDLNRIISNNPNAIIIIAGDHGPHLQQCGILNSKSKAKSGAYLLDDYGVHISIRWPTQDFEKYDNFHYLQGVFHSVLAYLTEDPSLLKSQPTGIICQNEICASHDTPITAGPDKGKMIYDTI